MKHTHSEQEELLDKFNKGLCTPEEIAVVENWYNKQSLISKDELPEPDLDDANDAIWKGISGKLTAAGYQAPSAVRTFSIKRLLVAASLFVVLGAGLFYFATQYANGHKESLATTQAQIKPGTNKAYLTLADGKRIALTDSTTGTLALQGSVKITKTADGQIAYQIVEQGKEQAGKYNTLEAPKGGQYQITLIDGTKVWLNAASALKYPTKFDGAERKVELTGEAYFEVAKDKKKPFRIISDNQTIEVLGTHFNVNAYSDESAIKTTLLEGSVKVFRTAEGSSYKILAPGQQSVLSPSALNVKEVDTEEAVAWKEGYFIFDNDNLKALMRKLERWYDVEVDYQGIADDKTKITGTLTRNTQLAEVLKLLEETDKFKFKTEGRRITIMR
ncbi:FecR family protein [Pedobacter africanus]|uniref:FecR family protein n=1 Tax=Pedobacter africanus TaxID=151894 RepID=A0A1W2CKX4_9SPHI|nr:FecR domain-containing protein [Pedobacter africanus]SMC85634.1 FecR family protein [Pedobacter africanus]